MADITPVALDTTLAAETWTTASNGGDKIVQPSGTRRLVLEFKNVNASARTITITAQDTAPTLAGYGVVAVEDKVLALADGSSTPTYSKPVEIPKLGFNNPADSDKVAVTYSSEVGVLLRAFYMSA